MTAMMRPDDELSIGRYLDENQGSPTVRRIVLGAQLRKLRQACGISREDAGRTIRGSHAKITRLERGQVGFKHKDLVDLLTLYRVLDPKRREEYFELARQANVAGWWQQYNDVLEDWFELHIGLEEAAALIRTYQVQFLPGLLQTRSYADAVTRLGYPNEPDAKIERLVELRIQRQELLSRPEPPQLWAVLDEAVLRRTFGGAEVMRAQLEHLLDVVERMPHVTVQVAPFSVGAHAAAGSPISILRFPEPELPDKVYLEQLTGGLYLDKQEEIDQYSAVMDRLCTAADPPEETQNFLKRLIGRLT
ncbi:helix-turn-helix domain-containing protein [Streptomyces natalensis]|uniref:XRE family transcriptional regulator n=1 Tax=Streptomyces natalensis ATCC 27448 TaxID=1240678 RepID=A0A0D7CIM0_9ACTN|nr:helix-turn-helix transcriptional regulator [Streptomyces natalensis]KIZ16109.1 XRE family transcriptional regulator [Streptomyces natalensis ATCC 27448]